MSDDQTARLGLPYLAAGQMQKHVTLNEALTRLDALVQTAVVSRTLSSQPAGPPDGALYILPPGAAGAVWAGTPEGALIRAEAGGWSLVEAPDGLVVLVADAGEVIVRDGGAWVSLGARLDGLQNLTRLGFGTTADAGNPFAARLNKALWTALEAGAGGDGDLRLTLNKEGPSNVLSLLFQSGWGGRAELGLVGDDDLRLKVSADGSVWRDAWSVDRASGQVSFDLGATRRTVTVLEADADYAVPPWARTMEVVAIGGGGGGGAGAFGPAGSRFGGGGGGAGGVSRAIWPAQLLAAGSAVQLGPIELLVATGGAGGGLGGALDGAAGAAGAGMPTSNAGGASSVTTAGGAGESFGRPDAPGGGGAGGGLDGSGTAWTGGAGGDGGVLAVKAAGGAGGSGSPGDPGSAATHPSLHWAGGGGGGGGAVASGAGHDGGSGGPAGGGGGGGGAGVAGGGAGGAGAAGRVWLIAQG